MNINDLISLPIEIQFALAAGYAGYVVAFTGIRASHKSVDTIFLVIFFSAIATLFIKSLESYGLLVAGVSALIGNLIIAAFWRKVFRQKFRTFLRNNDISWSNDDATALATLCDDSKNFISQVAVELDDGTWLRCDDTTKFRGAAYSPLLLGPSGDVAIYLTHEDKVCGEGKELKSVRDPQFGDRITYVPAAKIRQITIRHKPRED